MRKAWQLTSTGVVLAFLLTGCGSGDAGDGAVPSPSVTPSAGIGAVLPDAGGTTTAVGSTDGFLLPQLASLPDGTAVAAGTAVSPDVIVATDDATGVTTSTWGPVTVLQSGKNAPVVQVAPGGSVPTEPSMRTLIAGSGEPDKVIHGNDDIVLLSYVAMSKNTGQELASTWARGAASTVRVSSLPASWSDLLIGMGEGERRLLTVPVTAADAANPLVKATEGDTVIAVVDLGDVVPLPTGTSGTGTAAIPTAPASPTAAPGTGISTPIVSPSINPIPIATTPAKNPSTGIATQAPQPIVTANPKPSTAPTFTPVPAAMFGLHVPWALQTNYPINGTEYVKWEGEWPTVPFSTVRLWDTRTTWAMIEPTQGQFVWNTLDGQIAQAKQNQVKDITFVLGGTPEWAATTAAPGSAPWIGANSAAVPDEQAWIAYVTAVATRYKGIITSYQLWNEPNSTLFWQGTPAQIARLVQVAARTIHKIDPKATVVSPGMVVSNQSAPAATKRWFAALANAGWPVDAVAVHIYPDATTGTDGFKQLLNRTRTVIRDLDWSGPIWLTETSYIDRTSTGIEPQTQRELVARSFWIARDLGVSRLYWYAWAPTHNQAEGEGTLLLLQPGSAGAAGYNDAYIAGRSTTTTSSGTSSASAAGLSTGASTGTPTATATSTATTS